MKLIPSRHLYTPPRKINEMLKNSKTSVFTFDETWRIESFVSFNEAIDPKNRNNKNKTTYVKIKNKK